MRKSRIASRKCMRLSWTICPKLLGWFGNKGKKILDMKVSMIAWRKRITSLCFRSSRKSCTSNLIWSLKFCNSKTRKPNKSFAKAMVLEALEGLIQKDLLTQGQLTFALCNQLYEEKRSFLKKFNPKTDLKKWNPWSKNWLVMYLRVQWASRSRRKLY